MAIRRLLKSHLESVKELDRAAFSAAEQYDDGMYQAMLQSERSVVALDDADAIVGHAFVQMNPYTRVRSLAVHPASRGKGYAKAMLRAVAQNGGHDVDLFL